MEARRDGWGPLVLGHFEGEGPGPGWGCKAVGRAESNPSLWKLTQMGCPRVSLGGGRESGAPMPCLLPSLKLECEKLASEKTEMQRHYVMVRG